MKFKFSFLFVVISAIAFAQLPKGFVYVEEIIPNIKTELRYITTNNFVGKPIEGYLANKLILTKKAAVALKKVQDELESYGFFLKVYDAYRPQRAVNHFIDWAKKLSDTVNKKQFYPNVKKENLFKEEYIASRSGHSRGSTLDITIIDKVTNVDLNMGSSYDFFGVASWVNYKGISEEQKANRLLLQTVMKKHGFTNYPKEWWHFTLLNEPFPKTYFDFEIE
ncbi:MAG: M15 family metallopeptidase [Flavobacteriaceae bacterium]|nr:M15 family metallopeptidase [Flavobacteriaceae bacterium]